MVCLSLRELLEVVAVLLLRVELLLLRHELLFTYFVLECGFAVLGFGVIVFALQSGHLLPRAAVGLEVV